MSAEAIVAAFMADASITALVSTRKALAQLPQNTTYPAIVYTIISVVPQPIVAYQQSGQRALARVQINPMGATIASVLAMHAAIRAVMDFKHTVSMGGHTVVSSRLDLIGPIDKDNEGGIWTQPADYQILFVE